MNAQPIPEQVQEQIGQVDSADLVVAILADYNSEGFAAVCEDLRMLSGSPRVAILRGDQAFNPDPTSPPGVERSGSPYLVDWPLLRPDVPGTPMVSMSTAYQSVFEASDKLGARACCVIASKLETAAPDLACRLAQPLLEKEIDFVAPHYARHKFEGLLNSSIIAPLMRSLYGKRIHNPMGPDLGISRRLFQKMLGTDGGGRLAGNRTHPLASVAPVALCENFQVCEINVGARIYPPTDWTNISSIIAQVLSPIFLDMERNAVHWQRTRASVPVPAFGNPVFVSEDTGSVDVRRMVESFQLAIRDLQEIWGLVLPPSTLVELRKLSRLPLEQFHLSDELWVRIVYDFALGHRLRTINRDHLLKSMTPLYLAWVASYARDLDTAGAAELQQRLERLSMAYESGKPYLMARWRWPDRFNP
jgi:glucosylglycerate synthase